MIEIYVFMDERNDYVWMNVIFASRDSIFNNFNLFTKNDLIIILQVTISVLNRIKNVNHHNIIITLTC